MAKKRFGACRDSHGAFVPTPWCTGKKRHSVKIRVRKCKFGKLKSPKGKRICKKK